MLIVEVLRGELSDFETHPIVQVCRFIIDEFVDGVNDVLTFFYRHVIYNRGEICHNRIAQSVQGSMQALGVKELRNAISDVLAHGFFPWLVLSLAEDKREILKQELSLHTVEFRLAMEEVQEHLMVPCIQRGEVLTAIVQKHVEHFIFVFCLKKELVRIVFGELLDLGRHPLFRELRDEYQLMINIWK